MKERNEEAERRREDMKWRPPSLMDRIWNAGLKPRFNMTIDEKAVLGSSGHPSSEELLQDLVRAASFRVER